ncbi:hypothetical protein J7E49_21850 [Variovorax paradoxus]|nr:hypothetical protein [Variovorax paradoxus]
MCMTKKAIRKKVRRPASRPLGISSRPRIEGQVLENLLKRFDPKLHGGEVMAWGPLGLEVLP